MRVRATASPVCSGPGNEGEESLHISKGDMYLFVQFRGQQRAFSRIESTCRIKDPERHNRRPHVGSVSRERRNVLLLCGPSHSPRAFIIFRIMTTPHQFSPARNSHLSSRQTSLLSTSCTVSHVVTIMSPKTCCCCPPSPASVLPSVLLCHLPSGTHTLVCPHY